MSLAASLVAGTVIILFTLVQIFMDLFQPDGTGWLSSHIGRLVFNVCRARRSLIRFAGPVSILIVIGIWTALLATGFGIIYGAAFPSGFTFDDRQPHGFDAAMSILAYSFDSLTTLGSTDFRASAGWVRLLCGVESLLGFSLVTASISWILLIYPALGRVRTLSRKASVLRRTAEKTGLSLIANMSSSVFVELTGEVLRVRVDLIHFPLIYYFEAASAAASFPDALKTLLDFAAQGMRSEHNEQTRLAASILNTALGDVADLLASRFVSAPGRLPRKVFQRLAEDHASESD